jgi:multidrug efflux pump subunit AcrA (membrane-fusion protein)
LRDALQNKDQATDAKKAEEVAATAAKEAQEAKDAHEARVAKEAIEAQEAQAASEAAAEAAKEAELTRAAMAAQEAATRAQEARAARKAARQAASEAVKAEVARAAAEVESDKATCEQLRGEAMELLLPEFTHDPEELEEYKTALETTCKSMCLFGGEKGPLVSGLKYRLAQVHERQHPSKQARNNATTRWTCPKCGDDDNHPKWKRCNTCSTKKDHWWG